MVFSDRRNGFEMAVVVVMLVMMLVILVMIVVMRGDVNGESNDDRDGYGYVDCDGVHGDD